MTAEHRLGSALISHPEAQSICFTAIVWMLHCQIAMLNLFYEKRKWASSPNHPHPCLSKGVTDASSNPAGWTEPGPTGWTRFCFSCNMFPKLHTVVTVPQTFHSLTHHMVDMLYVGVNLNNILIDDLIHLCQVMALWSLATWWRLKKKEKHKLGNTAFNLIFIPYSNDLI